MSSTQRAVHEAWRTRALKLRVPIGKACRLHCNQPRMYERTLRRVAIGAQRQLLLGGRIQHRSSAVTTIRLSAPNATDPEALLSKPTWSVASLLPSETAHQTSEETPEITTKQLHHLLLLSALPPPRSEQEEQKLLATLSSQLHFVKCIQQVDTTGVKPLQSLRDETRQGERETGLGLEALRKALGKEEVRGKFHRRIRRVRGGKGEHEAWDVLGAAERKVGRFFVVEGGKGT